jgi:hypothetical protein
MPQDSTSGLSGIGGYMQQLADLQESDPDQFKAKAAEIAEQLEAAAAEASENGDSKLSEMLTGLAGKFSTAAETGEMPDLSPPDGGAPPMGPPPGPPPGSETTTDSTTSSSSVEAGNLQQLMSLFQQQSSDSDPMSVLSDVLASVLSTSLS